MRRHLSRLAASALSAALVGCGGGGGGSSDPLPDDGFFGVVQYSPEQITSHLDVVYSRQPNLRGKQYTRTVGGSANDDGSCGQPADADQSELDIAMDIYTPPAASPPAGFSGRPVIIRIHGGGFKCGNKNYKGAETTSYAQAGYVGVSINYRLTPDNAADPQLRAAAQAMATIDLQDAIRYLRAHAADYGIDPNRIATIGGSAGGGASLLNAVFANDGIPPELAAALPPAYLSGDAHVQAAVSSGATLIDEQARNTTRLLTVDAGDSPSLILHADPQDPATGATWTDNVLPTQQMFHEAGAVCEVFATPGNEHVVDMTVGFTYWREAIHPFLLQHLLK